MKKGLTELVFILDKSGSMHGLEGDTIGGYNSLLEKQKKEPGSANVTTVLFSSDIRLLYDRVPIDSVPALTDKEYTTGGMTALLDAVGTTVDRLAQVEKQLADDQKAEKVIIAIITDGFENASREYRYETLKRLIEHQKNKYDWEFLFLGANMDAVAEASHFGIGADRAATFVNDGDGIAANYSAVGNAMAQLRSAPLASAVDDSWKADIEADVKRRGKKNR